MFILYSFCKCSNGLDKIDDPKERERQLSLNISERVNRIMLCVLSQSATHLKQVELDVDPRHEAFWIVGGIDPSMKVQNSRKGLKCSEEIVMAPVERPFQYTGLY